MDRLQRIVQAHRQGPRTAAAGDYDRLFQDLVKVVDDFTDAAKKADDGERTLDRILAKARETLPEDSDELYGFTQDVTEIRDDLAKAKEASDSLGEAYDALNKRALRYRMR
jgi:hypothetical protein